MSYVSGLRCLSCHRPVATDPFDYFCPGCGGFLDVEYDYETMRRNLSRSDLEGRRGTIMSQWLDFLPIERPDLIERVTLESNPLQ